MDVAGFLRGCREEWHEFADRDRLAVSTPRWRRRVAKPTEIEGYATENKLMLLSLAARYIEPGEVLVEVGYWRGLSWAAGADRNGGAPVYACDGFTGNDGGAGRLPLILQEQPAAEHVHLFDQGYRDFLASAPWHPARVGVFFYDGVRTFRDVLAALALIGPQLSAQALIVIDQTDHLWPRRASRRFLRQHRDFELLHDVLVKEYQGGSRWTGIRLIGHRAHGTDGSRGNGSPAGSTRTR